MAIYKNQYYTFPQEVWDEKECEKRAKHLVEDGFGTPYPFRGYIGMLKYGQHRLNGGFVKNGDWYEGYIVLLPKIDDKYEIVRVPSWGYRIVKKEQ